MNALSSERAQYAIITSNYWSFTLTDGALRMLIVLHFYQLGFNALSIAFLFLFYEIFGVITNLVGGWLGAKIGLNKTMNLGLALQAVALAALLVPSAWLTVSWVMAAQALSGIAKDLNKMSAKTGIKLLVPKNQDDHLFKWVAALTGSKNALKGFGFFVGGFLLWLLGFWWAIFCLFSLILVTGFASLVLLKNDLGRAKSKPKFSQLFSNSAAINWLSLARLCLFASRDVWFVVALPISLNSFYGWSHAQVGSFFAAWVIIYGFIQAATPKLLTNITRTINGETAFWSSIALSILMIGLTALAVSFNLLAWQMAALLIAFGAVFAINSAVHSFLIVKWARAEGASLDVGFYYMSNALGRLAGTVLSGALYVNYGLKATLIMACIFLITVNLSSIKLRRFH